MVYFVNDEDFVAFYRFRKENIMEIAELLQNDLQLKGHQKKSMNAILQVCTALNRLFELKSRIELNLSYRRLF